MDRRARSRSGSEEREVLQNRFRKIRKEKRSGVSFKRRYRSACLKLLTYFIRVLTAQTEHPDYDPYDPHSLYLERRKLQAEEQLKRVEDYQLPRRDQPLLARLEPVPDSQGKNSGYYSEDSFVAETVAISDEESETEIQCPFSEPRFIEIFHRLVREGKIKKGKVVQEPYVPVVLDTVRFPKETLRTDTYRILPEVQDSLQQLHDQFPGCLIVINSYCCSEYYRKGVASINHPLVAHTITTEDRVTEKGKFSALTQIADKSCILVHFDDSADVVKEWRDLTAGFNNQLGIFGIKVPRHWKTQRAVTGVSWYQNILDAIQDVCAKYRVKESR
ncbi:unnamed protein product [Cladocopium goreaui]|uniref:Uncharacterized protein n=1 Tax=Cladocopium goreaui TaxID=2562237 RepID=A0A9P1BKV5_9DINO|nr:unnamed protein product [Cladocopium goreaui]